MPETDRFQAHLLRLKYMQKRSLAFNFGNGDRFLSLSLSGNVSMSLTMKSAIRLMNDFTDIPQR